MHLYCTLFWAAGGGARCTQLPLPGRHPCGNKSMGAGEVDSLAGAAAS